MNSFVKFVVVFVVFIFGSCIGLPTLSENAPNLKIYGGKTAEPGQFPFAVSIITLGFHWCGGVIINENWILTVASCASYFPLMEYTVRAGTNVWNKNGTLYDTSVVIKHPDFNESTYSNDLALLKIRQTFEFGDFLKPIEIGEVAAGDSVTMTGWGFIGDSRPTTELQYIEEKVLAEDECKELSQGGFRVFDLGPGQVCAISERGTGICGGDEGGPLISNGTVVGLASYSVGICEKHFPDVYTRTASYVDWIKETIANN